MPVPGAGVHSWALLAMHDDAVAMTGSDLGRGNVTIAVQDDVEGGHAADLYRTLVLMLEGADQLHLAGRPDVVPRAAASADAVNPRATVTPR